MLVIFKTLLVTGLLIAHRKKVKFYRIFRDKFVEEWLIFARNLGANFAKKQYM